MDRSETVSVSKEDGIAWVVMNRPEKRNAMSPELHLEMDQALEQLEADPEVRCLVLTGAGSAFSAGQDLKAFFRELEGKPAEQLKVTRIANRWRWERLYNFQKPTIAMVNGYCIGGAFTQLIACDFAVAADGAEFCLSEINWGMIPGGLVTKAVTEAVGYRDALELCLTGRVFNGAEALRLRLVNYSVSEDELRSRTIELAKLLMSKDPEAFRLTKQAVRRVRALSVEESYDYLAAKVCELRQVSGDRAYKGGIKQFVDDKSYRPVYETFTHNK